MPAGRPTSYKPEFCADVVPFMEQGYSKGALAGHLGVAKSTLYLWIEEHEEFSDAIKEGEAASQQWWEGVLRNCAAKGEGNSTAAIFGLKNRAADDWRDRKEHDHTSSDASMSPKDVSPEIAAAIAAKLID